MIDTHLHILPGFDDGPETIEEALALARALVLEGVHSAIATPHYNDQFPKRSAEMVREQVHELQQVLDDHGIPLHLFAGHEALIQPGMIEDIQAGQLSTLNGSRYLLLELWNSSWLPQTEQVIFELRSFGIVPVIAHIERYKAIQQYPDRLLKLLEQGVLIQLTVGSLLGMHGNTTRKWAEMLLKKGYVHCIASDAHGIGKRLPAIRQSMEILAQLIGLAQVKLLSEAIPLTIAHNKEVSEASTRQFRLLRGLSKGTEQNVERGNPER